MLPACHSRAALGGPRRLLRIERRRFLHRRLPIFPDPMPAMNLGERMGYAQSQGLPRSGCPGGSQVRQGDGGGNRCRYGTSASRGSPEGASQVSEAQKAEAQPAEQAELRKRAEHADGTPTPGTQRNVTDPDSHMQSGGSCLQSHNCSGPHQQGVRVACRSHHRLVEEVMLWRSRRS